MSAEQDAPRLNVARSKERLLKVLQRLQWTEESVLQQHRPEIRSKIVEDANELPPSCMSSTKHSVQLDDILLQQLVGEVIEPPKTFDDLQCNYSATQKLSLYEHVLKCTPQHHVSFEDNANFAELVTLTKRAQQNQRRHRKTKPTLKEEMHQLVSLQMQALQQQQQQQQQQEQLQLHPPPYRRDQQQRVEYRQRSRSLQKREQDRERKERKRSRSRQRHKTKKRSRSSSRSHSRSSSHQRHKRSHYN